MSKIPCENWPNYRLRSSVRAMKILLVRVDGPIKMIVPDDQKFPWFAITDDYYQKYKPQPGGYYVIAESGDATYVDADAFEKNFERE